ncbi:hypothetical protein [Thermoflexibacter ruber]|uniref:Uncharacterized protein n=1 Tax=Thermoflexibacter ruber TaxID=1003 RepID=A0A1I2KFD8_9BACT|nr:hypothetical protein [Thermoflexibacter ruber]SFF63656.1 hypothetical protein SAMN04488541_10993 [Thermoflexibacter ruber]
MEKNLLRKLYVGVILLLTVCLGSACDRLILKPISENVLKAKINENDWIAQEVDKHFLMKNTKALNSVAFEGKLNRESLQLIIIDNRQSLDGFFYNHPISELEIGQISSCIYHNGDTGYLGTPEIKIIMMNNEVIEGYFSVECVEVSPQQKENPSRVRISDGYFKFRIN